LAPLIPYVMSSSDFRPSLTAPLNGSTEPETVTVKGSVNKIRFRNSLNGYSVLTVLTSTDNLKETVVGICYEIEEGNLILARGKYVTNPKYGRQLSADTIERISPDSLEGLERYLASGAIKGIGGKTSQRLVEAFGLRTLEVVLNEPDTVASIIGKDKAHKLSTAFTNQNAVESARQDLIKLGLTTTLASRLVGVYGAQAPMSLRANPYRLIKDFRGIGFRTADSIALNHLGMARDSEHRLCAGLYYALVKSQERGDCFLERDVLLQEAAEELALRLSDTSMLHPHLHTLLINGEILEDHERFYLPDLLKAETFLGDFIRDRIPPLQAPLIPYERAQVSLDRAQSDFGFLFSDEQRAAVLASLSHRISIITGGPGCGKTTLVRALAHIYLDAGKALVLTAPTGKASQRLSSVCGHPALTIHRLLKFNGGSFVFGADNPLTVDVIIVDESSMIDLSLAQSLFSALPHHCHLVLVGDKDQLPSVGPGKVFHDIIVSRKVMTSFLSHLYRRDDASSINTYAHEINMGEVPSLPTPNGEIKSDAYLIPCHDPEHAARLVENLVASQLPKKFNLDADDITVLTPSNRGPLGTVALNKRLQTLINPLNAGTSGGMTIGDVTLQVGDRIIQRVNNYNIHDQGVFNGDSGIVELINPLNRKVTIRFWDGRLVEYEEKDLTQLSLAYALTIHRSQGSEMSCVVLVAHEAHYPMLERQLLYTGVTRAKKLLIIVGTERALAIACRKTSATKRRTWLAERLKA
jgi:exodeoxyribonuclease V alpha subunit